MVGGLELKTANLQALYSSTKQNVEEAAAQLSKIYADLDDASISLALREADRDALSDEISELSNHRDEIRKGLLADEQEHQSKLDTIKADGELYLAQYRGEVEALEERAKQGNREIETANSAFIAVNENIADVNKELEYLLSRKITLAEDINAVAEKGRDLVDQITTSTKQLEEIEKNIRDRNLDLDALAEELRIKQEEVAPISEKLSEREAAIKSKEKDLETLRARFNRYSMENFGFPASI